MTCDGMINSLSLYRIGYLNKGIAIASVIMPFIKENYYLFFVMMLIHIFLFKKE